VIHHVSVEVSDLERAGRFYDSVLGPLGWRRQVETDERVGWGIFRPVFFVSARHGARAGGGHVAFAANGISAVKAAWEAGINAGGINQGDPGQRPEYGPTYYAAYLRDPDGHRVEVTVGID
jgi:catechol 2,3-dioxygenase-like lactoylglutathione lyase family enzyme